jgi:hypothetical protein
MAGNIETAIGEELDYMSYAKFVKEMITDNWHREQITVDQTNTNVSATIAVAVAGATSGANTVITITCPSGRVMSMMGTQQVARGADRSTAHSIWLRLSSLGIELNELTHINIQKTTPTTAVVPLIKDIYQSLSLCNQHNINTLNPPPGTSTQGNFYKGDDQIHRFRKGIILYGQEALQIQAVGTTAMPLQIVSAANTQFAIDMDFWTQTV